VPVHVWSVMVAYWDDYQQAGVRMFRDWQDLNIGLGAEAGHHPHGEARPRVQLFERLHHGHGLAQGSQLGGAVRAARQVDLEVRRLLRRQVAVEVRGQE
jgi:hypothetical protein